VPDLISWPNGIDTKAHGLPYVYPIIGKLKPSNVIAQQDVLNAIAGLEDRLPTRQSR
jgi:hypothetical protein